jgi:hypothetical protein
MRYVKTLTASLAAAAVAVALSAVAAPPAVAATPTPTPSSCTLPKTQSFDVTPTRVASGDSVQVTVQVADLCESTQPSHTITVYSQRPQDAAPMEVARTTTDSNGRAAVPVVVTESTALSARSDGNTLGSPSTGTTTVAVTVDRTSGSCANALTLSAPATAPTGSGAEVTGTATDTGTVNILFRKRGQAAFQVRRVVTPAADRTFRTGFVADDDYRLYAASSLCDSPPVLVQAKPTIGGPNSVRKGSAVTLLVRAPAGFPVKIYFRRAGATSFQLGRMGTVPGNGRYVTTYAATADYRYYAVTGNDRRQSNIGLTQAR